MSKPINLNTLYLKALRDTVEDGLIELFIGIVFFTISGALRTTTVYFAVLLIVFMGTPFLKFLKRHITYPRIGYVEFPQDKSRKPGLIVLYWLLAVTIFISVLMAFTGDLVSPVQWYPWTPLWFGLIITGFVFLLGVRTRMVRFFVYGLIFFTGSFYYTLTSFEGKLTALANYMLAMSGIMLILGAINLVRFIIANPVQQEEARHATPRNG